MYQYLILNNCIAAYSEDAQVRHLLSEILRLRFSSYRQYYGYQSIPTDLFDFIGTHLVINKVDGDTMKAVVAYRITTKLECTYYGQNFPYIEHMHSKQTVEETHIIERASQFIEHHTDLGYVNAYAVEPTLPKEEKAELIQRGLAFYAQFSEDNNNLPLITAVTDKFKVFRDFYEIGFEYITGDYQTSTFTAPHIMEERFRSMILKQQTPYAQRLKKRYHHDYQQAMQIECGKDTTSNQRLSVI